ncbi:MAG: hypothetical protein HON33_00715 [Flavobacteriaceae bacterium]|jgi:hypothetical protein|nr:hypothetical protein [Flavobacteriaceae bacterium]MBT6169969.1 hypothetical protein [Flavobacteriaceae bacterium]MBT6448771.1 hypothetical protein [Flavobacteriaceae bacterium]
MNLYFNTKLVGSTIHENSKDTFYPVVMPKNHHFDKQVLPFKILKSVLISYSKLKFKKCVFNIETDNEEYNKEVKDLLINNFKNTELNINFIRPYDKNTWIDDIQNNFGSYLDEPILLAMNHDHQYVDYQTETLENILNKIFSKDRDNFKKVFFYSHIPELISFAENRKYIQNRKYKNIEKSMYKINSLNYQVDSVSIMTARTLRYIISQISNDIEYFGRIDWKNLYFKKLNISGFFFAREFFRHFEGYHHISGIRITKELSLNTNSNNFNLNKEPLDFYYHKWLSFSIFLIRDGLKSSSCFKKKKLIKLAEKSITIFNESYIDEDFNSGLISKEDSIKIKYNLRSKVFYNLNKIYSEIKIENELTKENFFNRLKNIYNSRIKYFEIIRLIKKIIKLK